MFDVLFNRLLTDQSFSFSLHLSEKYLAVHSVLHAQHSLSTFPFSQHSFFFLFFFFAAERISTVLSNGDIVIA